MAFEIFDSKSGKAFPQQFASADEMRSFIQSEFPENDIPENLNYREVEDFSNPSAPFHEDTRENIANYEQATMPKRIAAAKEQATTPQSVGDLPSYLVGKVAFPMAMQQAQQGADEGDIMAGVAGDVAMNLTGALGKIPGVRPLLGKALQSAAMAGESEFGQGDNATLASDIMAGAIPFAGRGGPVSTSFGEKGAGLQKEGAQQLYASIARKSAHKKGANPFTEKSAERLLSEGAIPKEGTPNEAFSQAYEHLTGKIEDIGALRDQVMQNSPLKVNIATGAVQNAKQKIRDDIANGMDPQFGEKVLSEIDSWAASNVRQNGVKWQPMKIASRTKSELNKAGGAFAKERREQTPAEMAKSEIASQIDNYIANISPEAKAMSGEMAPYMAMKAPIANRIGQASATNPVSFGEVISVLPALAKAKNYLGRTPQGAALKYDIGASHKSIGDVLGKYETPFWLRQETTNNEE